MKIFILGPIGAHLSEGMSNQYYAQIKALAFKQIDKWIANIKDEDFELIVVSFPWTGYLGLDYWLHHDNTRMKLNLITLSSLERMTSKSNPEISITRFVPNKVGTRLNELFGDFTKTVRIKAIDEMYQIEGRHIYNDLQQAYYSILRKATHVIYFPTCDFTSKDVLEEFELKKDIVIKKFTNNDIRKESIIDKNKRIALLSKTFKLLSTNKKLLDKISADIFIDCLEINKIAKKVLQHK